MILVQRLDHHGKLCQMPSTCQEEHPITSRVGFSSNAVRISRISDNSWAIYGFPRRNSDWEGAKSLLLREELKREL